MKSLWIILLSSVLGIQVFGQSDYYFYYKNKKQYLQKINDKKYVLFEPTLDTTKLKEKLDAPELLVQNYGHTNNIADENYIVDETYSKKWTIIESSQDDLSVQDIEDVTYEADFFINQRGVEAGLSHLFYVKLKKEEDLDTLKIIARKNKVNILSNNKFMPLWHTLACTKESKGNALEMANKFFEKGIFEYAEPDFMTAYLPACTNTDQWGLNNTGQYGGINGIDVNFCLAQQITLGRAEIIIAIVDRGFDRDHPGYLNSVHPNSYDTETGTSPSQLLGAHGTQCAGIIASNPTNNNLSLTGIAPDCQIMSISNQLDISPNTSQELADGINFAWMNGADVISNSWLNDGYESSFLDDAISNALELGRNGLGSVVVFSAGNQDGAIKYPANSNLEIITVGAVSPCSERKSKNPTSCDGEDWWGSNFGVELDIVAPGVFIPTTDLLGHDGMNNNNTLHDYANKDYTKLFRGTSASAPHVAAVAGLILTRNTHITQSQVSDIIESTAQKIGNYDYQIKAGRPNGIWNNEVGYGLVDAYAAVQSCPTTNIANDLINEDTEISGCEVNLNNINVGYNSKLIIDAENNVNITHNFEVQLNSELVIK